MKVMKKLCAQILSRYEALWDCGRARTICERNIMKKVYRSETVNKLFFSGTTFDSTTFYRIND